MEQRSGLSKFVSFPAVLLPFLLLSHWEEAQRFGAAPVIGAVLLALGIILVWGGRSQLLLFPFVGLTAAGIALLFAVKLPLIFVPSILSGLVGWQFLRTLRAGRVTLVQQMAERSGKVLPPFGVRYCWYVTVVWGVVLMVNAAIGVLAWEVSPSFWRIYNGFIAYLVFAGLFALEFTVRFFIRRRIHASRAG